MSGDVRILCLLGCPRYFFAAWLTSSRPGTVNDSGALLWVLIQAWLAIDKGARSQPRSMGGKVGVLHAARGARRSTARSYTVPGSTTSMQVG